jgi:hypothetical protein
VHVAERERYQRFDEHSDGVVSLVPEQLLGCRVPQHDPPRPHVADDDSVVGDPKEAADPEVDRSEIPLISVRTGRTLDRTEPPALTSLPSEEKDRK